VIEAFVVGRIGVDFTPSEPRTSLAEATTFRRAVGGFAGNIGTGLARLGIATGVVSSVGDDGHGDHVRSALAAEGISVAGLTTQPGARTQVAFFEAWPPDEFPVTFYRLAPAPDTLLAVSEVPLDELAAAPLIIVSGALLAVEPARSTALAILADRLAARDRRAMSWTILDLDWRPSLWPDPGDYPGLVERAAELSDVLIGSDAEFAAAGLAPAAVAHGPRIVVLKHGQDGVSLLAAGRREALPGIPVEVTCGLGSGDALTAAVAAGLLQGLDPLAAIARGNAAGAIVASRLMCSAAMPVPAEIDELLARVPGGLLASHAQEALP